MRRVGHLTTPSARAPRTSAAALIGRSYGRRALRWGCAHRLAAAVGDRDRLRPRTRRRPGGRDVRVRRAGPGPAGQRCGRRRARHRGAHSRSGGRAGARARRRGRRPLPARRGGAARAGPRPRPHPGPLPRVRPAVAADHRRAVRAGLRGAGHHPRPALAGRRTAQHRHHRRRGRRPGAGPGAGRRPPLAAARRRRAGRGSASPAGGDARMGRPAVRRRALGARPGDGRRRRVGARCAGWAVGRGGVVRADSGRAGRRGRGAVRL